MIVVIFIHDNHVLQIQQNSHGPYDGKNVEVFGSWNQFQVGTKLISRCCSLSLAVGNYQYKFLVDGQWKFLENQQKISDNHGSYNNVIEVLPKRAYQIFQNSANPIIRIFEEAEEVLGSWDNWTKPIKLDRRYNQFMQKDEFYAMINLEEGRYEFIFKKRDIYFYDPCQSSIVNQYGGKNNIMVILINKVLQHELDFTCVNWESDDLLYRQFDHIYGHTMTAVGNSFYIFGGVPSRNEIYKLSFEDHQLNLEDVDGEIPRPRAYHLAIPYGDKILFFGGVDEHNILNDHFVYVTSKRTWYLAKTDQKWTERERASMIFYPQDELVVLFGGYYLSPDMEMEVVYNDLYYMNIQTMSWVRLQIANSPEPRFGHTANQINEKMYVFGGRNQHQHFNDIWIFDFYQIKWIKQVTLGIAPEPRYGHSANLLKSKIVVFGGKNQHGHRLNDLHIFDYLVNTWITPIQQGLIPSPRYFHSAEIFNDEQLWILGGNIGLKRNEHFYILSFGKQQNQQNMLNI